MKRTTTLLAAAFWLGVAALTYFYWYEPRQKQDASWEQRRADAAQRKARGAYMTSEKEIAPGQFIGIVAIPHSSGIDFLDTKCIVYTHAEFKQANMVCPDAKQDDIEAQ